MENKSKTFPEIVDEAFDNINQFEGGNTLFYAKFHKSRAVVSTWKSGRVIPLQTDILKFIKVSSEVIRECKAIKDKMGKEQSKLMDEFSALTTSEN